MVVVDANLFVALVSGDPRDGQVLKQFIFPVQLLTQTSGPT